MAKSAKKKPGKETDPGLAALRQARIAQLISTVEARTNIANRLGLSFDTKRELYKALGYPTTVSYKDYIARYKRQDLARAVINRPVRECWKHTPDIVESEEQETEFEKAWVALATEHAVFSEFSRVDKLASIGRYAVLVLGLDGDMEKPAEKASTLLYVQPYDEDAADIKELEDNTQDPRFGRPKLYSVSFGGSGSSRGAKTTVVHHTRIIHVVQDRLQDNNYGTPQLEAIYNRLQDVETIAGASAEMFWQGAFQGLAFMLREGVQLTPDQETKYEDEIERYIHNMQRVLKLQGMDVEPLGGSIADPTGVIDKQFDLIAAATQIPKRILLGSERGELASSQDEREYKSMIDERRRLFCEPQIVRPFVDRMIELGVMPEPKEKDEDSGAVGYIVDWPDLFVLTELQKADVAGKMAKALRDYMDGNVGAIITPDMFLKLIANMSDNDIGKISAALSEALQRDTNQSGEGEE